MKAIRAYARALAHTHTLQKSQRVNIMSKTSRARVRAHTYYTSNYRMLTLYKNAPSPNPPPKKQTQKMPSRRSGGGGVAKGVTAKERAERLRSANLEIMAALDTFESRLKELKVCA